MCGKFGLKTFGRETIATCVGVGFEFLVDHGLIPQKVDISGDLCSERRRFLFNGSSWFVSVKIYSAPRRVTNQNKRFRKRWFSFTWHQSTAIWILFPGTSPWPPFTRSVTPFCNAIVVVFFSLCVFRRSSLRSVTWWGMFSSRPPVSPTSAPSPALTGRR